VYGTDGEHVTGQTETFAHSFDSNTTFYNTEGGDLSNVKEGISSYTVDGHVTFSIESDNLSSFSSIPLTLESGPILVFDNSEISNNNSLRLLELSGMMLTPLFKSNEYTYTVTVPYEVNETTVTYTTDESHATASLQLNDAPVNNPITLQVGENIIKVVVTAEDESQQPYIVMVTRNAAPVIPAPAPIPVPAPKSSFSSAVVKNVEQLSATIKETLEANKNAKVTFADTALHWASDDIGVASRLQFVAGYEDGSFKPNASVSRAEFSAMIVRSFHLKEDDKEASFSDIAQTNWAKADIEVLASNEILSGYQDGTFKPNQEITRAEMLTIISRILDLTSLNQEGPTPLFADITNGYWAQKIIEDATAAGLIHGISMDQFAPDNKATRAKALSLIIRSLKTDNSIAKLFQYKNRAKAHLLHGNCIL